MLMLDRFPDCQCDMGLNGSPYRIALVNRSLTLAGNQLHCFAFHAVPCINSAAACCNQDLYKMEMPVREYLHF
jgi:hypothetical protein